MKYKVTLNLIAVCALLTGSGAVIAHQDKHAPGNSVVKKEQKSWGIAGDVKAVTRSITVSMSDTMRFNPTQMNIKQGETIRFVIKNAGKVMHEMVLGTQKDLDDHAALMLKFPGMEHDEPYMAHVGPGKTGQIIWTFNRAGNFDFACLIAGHYQAGMVGKINVTAR